MGGTRSAGYGHNPWLARQHPHKRELRRRDALAPRPAPYQLSQRPVVAQRLRSEARQIVAAVITAEAAVLAYRACQIAAAERTIGHEAYAKFFERGENLKLRLAPPDGILALNCRHRTHAVGTPDGAGACLRQSEVQHLALLYQLCHGVGHLLYGRGRVYAVLIQQVDVVGAQPPQRALNGPAHMGHAAVESRRTTLLNTESELCGYLNIVSYGLQGLAHPLFACVRAVNLGRVKQRNALFVGAAYQRHHVAAVITAAIIAHHGQAAKAYGRHAHAAQIAALGLSLPPRAPFILACGSHGICGGKHSRRARQGSGSHECQARCRL